MIPASPEDQKKEAFRLFEDGRYLESLQYCQALPDLEKDPAIEILAATNLFLAGRLDDAEAAFLDLARTMPDSSYVHSYLAKVLEARGDEGATAEFARAVHLDPTNQDALRSYAAFLLGHRDFRGAMRVLRRLVHISRKPADLNNLMRALIEIGDPEEALAVCAVMGEGTERSPEYIDALIQTGDFSSAADAALTLYRTTKDPDMLRKHLMALSRYDPASSLDAYPAHIEECPDAGLLCDYIRLLQSTGNDREALAATRRLLALVQKPAYRLLECDLLARNGEDESALAAYELLIRDELATKNDLEELGRIIDHYREFLRNHGDPAGSKKRFLDLVSTDVNVASLIGTARFCHDSGDMAEARSWYYRAYRADFFSGGLAYARFLIEEGDDRECEKVMLYILANVKKGSDLARVAAAIVDENAKMFRLRRLMDQLVRRLEERRPQLHSDGLELLAMAYFITASNALEEMDFAGCKYLCLSAMDILPTPSRTLRLEDFLTLIRACKERSVADRPTLHARPQKKKKDAVPQAEVLTRKLGLTEPEQKIVMFLQAHRKATEMDLRKVLGTRRVVGMVNLLIRKAAGQGISIIEKKGVGEEGEVYEYTGT